MDSHEIDRPYWVLKFVYGAVPIVAGLDKFTNFLTDWKRYLSPLVSNILPVGPFMQAVGIVEIVAGVLVLTRFTRIGAYVVAAWLAAIAVNVLTTGHYFDVAVRDLVMATGAYTLAKLAEVRSHHAPTETAKPTAPLGHAHA